MTEDEMKLCREYWEHTVPNYKKPNSMEETKHTEAIKPYRERIIQAAREYQRKVEKDYPVMPSHLSQISAQIREAFYCGFELFEKDNADLLAKVSEQETLQVKYRDAVEVLNNHLLKEQAKVSEQENEIERLKERNDYDEQVHESKLKQYEEIFQRQRKTIDQQAKKIEELEKEKQLTINGSELNTLLYQEQIKKLEELLYQCMQENTNQLSIELLNEIKAVLTK